MAFLIKMMMKLLIQFIPIDDEDLSRITVRAKEWATTIRIDEAPDNKTPAHWKTIAKVLDGWGVQLLLCFGYLFAYSELQRMFREGKNDDDDRHDKI
jgi:hypothetical protein